MSDEKDVKETSFDRKFLGSDEVTEYFISQPTAEAIRGADWQYSRTYTKCLIEGITTTAEMTDILTRRGIIGPEFEQRAQELASELNNRIMELNSAETIEEKRDLAVKVAEARDEYYQWNQRLQGPLSNTCEQISDDARLEYLTSCIVKDSDGNRVWESYDDFLTTDNKELSIRARFEVMLYLQGLESNFLEDTPEAIALKEVEQDALDKAKNALDAAQVAAEEEVMAENAVEEQKSKKKGTSSKSSKSSKSTKNSKVSDKNKN